MHPREHGAAQALSLAEGRLAALAWGDAQAPTWLALHGWLDNAASYSRLAPWLASALGIRIVALDFRGHGHSAHAPRGTDYALWDYCHDVLNAMDALGLDSAPLLGHSMGAAVAGLVAATLAERVETLTLIDGLGALNTPAEATVDQLRKGLLAHRKSASRRPRYADIERAVAARVAGGVTALDAVTAYPLVERNTQECAEGGVEMRTDARLLKPSLVRFTPEQVLALLGAISAPVLLVEGERGILGERRWACQARDAVPHLTRHVVPGGHHLHLETEAVAEVGETIRAHWEALARGKLA